MKRRLPTRSATPIADDPGSDDVERRILQRRLSAFGRIAAAFILSYLLAFNYVNLLNESFDWTTNRSNTLHLFAAVVMAGVWLASWRGQPTLGTLKGIDAAGFWLAGVAFTVSVWTADPAGSRNWAMQLELANLMVARSVLVPSSGPRTIVLCGALVPWVVYAAYLFEVRRGQPIAEIVRHTAEGFLACSISVGIATLASQVIFGLRARIRDARRIGQYTLAEKVGEGAMGVVYRAQHSMLRRSTAIKLLPPEKSDARARARFEKEVQHTSQLTHPNTVAIYDYGRTRDGVFYFAMEYLDGLNLEQLVRRFGPQPPARVVYLLRQACSSLAEAHEAGLVHRDVKPANLVLCQRWGEADVVKVVDFGLVGVSASAIDRSSDDLLPKGTPLYMSPESIDSPGDVEPRSDLYSLGTVAYYLLTGRHVFEAETITDILLHHLTTTPKPPSARSGPFQIPPALDALVMACLAKKPADRPRSAAALKAALGACDGVGEWTQQQAKTWWEEFRHEARPTDLPAGAGTLALDIDLTGRTSEAAEEYPASPVRGAR
jgi:hypothetical protein